MQVLNKLKQKLLTMNLMMPDPFFEQLKSEHDRIPQDLPICLFTTCPQVFCYSDSIDRKYVLVHM